MPRIVLIILGGILLATGLLGFLKPNLMYLVQFDLYQSFLYAILGAIGLKLGLSPTTPPRYSQKYFEALAIINFILLMLGLFWPNWGDIFHLEVPEHFWHALIGITAALMADYLRRQAKNN